MEHVAFANPQGDYVLVLTNAGTEGREIRCRFDGKAADVSVPPDSVVTLQWS